MNRNWNRTHFIYIPLVVVFSFISSIFANEASANGPLECVRHELVVQAELGRLAPAFDSHRQAEVRKIILTPARTSASEVTHTTTQVPEGFVDLVIQAHGNASGIYFGDNVNGRWAGRDHALSPAEFSALVGNVRGKRIYILGCDVGLGKVVDDYAKATGATIYSLKKKAFFMIYYADFVHVSLP